MIISLPTSFKAFTKISFHDLHGQGKPRTSLGMDGRLDLSKPYGVLFLTPHLKIDHNVNFLRVKYYGSQTLPTGYTWGRMEPTHENFQKVKLGEVLRPFLKRSLCKPGLVMMSLISSSHQAKLSPSPSLPLLLLRSKTNIVKCRSQLKNLLWRRYQWDHLQLQFGLAVDDTLK